MLRFIAVVLTASLLVHVKSASLGCSNTDDFVNNCFNPLLVGNGLDPVDGAEGLQQLVPNMDAALDFHLMTRWTARTVSHECELLVQYASCTRHWVSHCDTTYRQIMTPMIDAIDYQCNAENQPKMVLYGACLKGEKETEFVKKAAAEYQSNLQMASYSGDVTQICQETNAYLNKIERGTTKICGAEASNFNQDIIIRMVKPMMEMISCSLDKDTDTYKSFNNVNKWENSFGKY